MRKLIFFRVLLQNSIKEKYPSYEQWENGGRNPKDETVEELAEIYRVTFDKLQGRNDGFDDIVDLLRKVELTDKQKLEIYFLIKKHLGGVK